MTINSTKKASSATSSASPFDWAASANKGSSIWHSLQKNANHAPRADIEPRRFTVYSKAVRG